MSINHHRYILTTRGNRGRRSLLPCGAVPMRSGLSKMAVTYLVHTFVGSHAIRCVENPGARVCILRRPPPRQQRSSGCCTYCLCRVLGARSSAVILDRGLLSLSTIGAVRTTGDIASSRGPTHGKRCNMLRRIYNAALVLQLGVLGQASNSQVARVSRAVSRSRGSSKEGGAFVGLLAAPLAWRHRCHKLGTHPAGRNRIARPAPPAVACSPEGSSALSATGPESEPPEEVQYGFWAPASKELHRDHWAPPASKKARFGGPSHVSSRRCLSTPKPCQAAGLWE